MTTVNETVECILDQFMFDRIQASFDGYKDNEEYKELRNKVIELEHQIIDALKVRFPGLYSEFESASSVYHHYELNKVYASAFLDALDLAGDIESTYGKSMKKNILNILANNIKKAV